MIDGEVEVEAGHQPPAASMKLSDWKRGPGCPGSQSHQGVLAGGQGGGAGGGEEDCGVARRPGGAAAWAAAGAGGTGAGKAGGQSGGGSGHPHSCQRSASSCSGSVVRRRNIGLATQTLAASTAL